MKKYRFKIEVEAAPYRAGLEDGYKSRSVGHRGRPYINTPKGPQFISEGVDGAARDWIIWWPDGSKEVYPQGLVEARLDEAPEVTEEELALALEEIEKENQENVPTQEDIAEYNESASRDGDGVGSVDNSKQRTVVGDFETNKSTESGEVKPDSGDAGSEFSQGEHGEVNIAMDPEIKE